MNRLVSRVWSQFVYCLKNILDGNRVYTKQDGRYKKMLQKELKTCCEATRELAEKFLLDLDRDLFPVIEYNLFRDYKRNDEVLIRHIPFILTYKSGSSMAAVFRCEASLSTMNDTVFKNAAAATVIKPGRITYLLYLPEDAKMDSIRRMIQTLSKYLKRKGITSEVDFCISGLRQIHGEQEKNWRRCFDDLMGNGMLSEYVFELADSETEAIKILTDLLKQKPVDLFDGSCFMFSSMSANAELLKVVQENYPYFEFESQRKRFLNNPKCKYLSYIQDSTYLGVEEMFGLAGASDMEFHYPVLGQDYKRLWAVYLGKNRGGKKNWHDYVHYNVKGWNILCDMLYDYDKSFPDRKKVYIDDLNGIFMKKYKDKYKWNDLLSILLELTGQNGGKKYILPDFVNNQDVLYAFSYQDEEIRSVLTKSGEILEIYTYFQLCEQGFFDEIACGYHFRWNGEIQNELDLVLTKGFSSIIVECKARTKLSQDFYFKLNSLVDIFGIGAGKVLITTAVTEEGDNKMQTERGNMMGITTISNVNDIENIAEKLREFMFLHTLK
jgi:hypothetical protein